MAYIGRQLARGENKLFDDISSSFNGSTTVFNLTVSSVATSTATPFQLFVSLGGVMQKPSVDFTTAGNQITFTTAPAAGLSCWIMMQGDTIDQAAIPDASVTPSKIANSGDFAFPADVRLKDGDGSHYVGFQAPTTVSANKVWTLPAADGSANQVLKTNGSGILSWAADSAVTEGTAVLSTGESSTSKFLRTDGDGTCSWQTVTGTTINNNANNRLITGSGTANTLEGEANLIFDQSNNKLTIDGSSNQKIVLTGATNPYINFQENTTDKAHLYWDTSGHLLIQNREDNAAIKLKDDLQFSTDSSTFYSILHQGNVGSGGKLASTNVYVNQIHGNGANLTSLNATNLGSGTVPTARLGSGTASAAKYLRGDGTWTWLSQSSVTQSTLIGASAGNNMTSGGLNNTLVGYQSAINLTSGDDNTTIGSEAGPYITTSAGNTCLGRRAGWGITTGAYNVVAGFEALGDQSPASVTGSYNIVLGYKPLTECTSGAQNVVLGKEAAINLTTGNNNVILAADAGNKLTTGSNNFYSGEFAGRNNTTGSGNIALGEQALYGTTGSSTPTNTIAIGKQSFTAVTSGTDNVGVGYRAGYALTTGSDNLFLGYSAGDNVTTGGKNIVIGRYADASSATVDYEATIGSTSITKFRVPGVNFIVKETTATNDYILTVDSNGECGWEAPAAAGVSSDSQYNTVGGTNAGDSIVSGGTNNTCFGYNAGTAITTADGSTSIGSNAGYRTTGGLNTYIGYDCGAGSGDHSRNTGVGWVTLQAITTGTRNTCVGEYNGTLITSGYKNTVLGSASLTACTTGYENIAIGSQSSTSLTTAQGNIAIGTKAGEDITTGSINTLVGKNAAKNLTTGGDNVGIGNGAFGTSTVTGSSNIAIGNYALDGFTSGNYNVGIGYGAGGSNSPSGTIGAGSNNICLGNNNIQNLYCADTSISSSDSRDKTDVTNFTHGLSWINKLNPVTYKWDKRTWYNEYNEDGSFKAAGTPDGSKKRARQHIGFLAQDVLAIEQADGFASKKDDMLVVNLNEDDTAYGLKYERLVPVLVNAIKELSTEVTTLKNKVAALESA